MTGAEVATAIRKEVSDEKTPYRYPDGELLGYINDGQLQIWRRRPSSIYTDTTVVVAEPSPISALSETLSTRDLFKDALVFYSSFRALSKDSEDSVNMQLATQKRQQYAQELS